MTILLSTGLREAMLITGSLKDIFEDGVIGLYDGTMPTSADAAEAGTLVAWITSGGLPFVAGAATNGLEFGAAVSHVTTGSIKTVTLLPKADAETWKGEALVDGTIRYGVLYDNAKDTGASETAIRLFGNVRTTSGGIFLATTVTAVDGVDITISSMNLRIPYGG